MKPIILRQHEVVHLRDHGSVIAWRVVKPQPDHIENLYTGPWPCVWQDKPAGCTTLRYLPAAHGRTGEERWVKETHAFVFHPDGDLDGEQYSVECESGETGRFSVRYAADRCAVDWDGGWRPSIFMHRWASRFTVTLDVGVKRIQEVTEEEAKMSGIKPMEFEGYEHPDNSALSRGAHRDAMLASNPYHWANNDYFWKITCTLKK